jgi:hypothetical protein
MGAPATAGVPTATAGGGGGAVVPFILASNIYVEKFNTSTLALTAASSR